MQPIKIFVHFSGIRFICSPYLAIKLALASLGPIMARCGPQMNLNYAPEMNIIVILQALVMWTPKAFHVREIPANNIIHVTDSLAVHQTHQNTSLFFSAYFPVKFCHRLRFSIEKNQIRALGISQQSTSMQVCVHIQPIRSM